MSTEPPSAEQLAEWEGAVKALDLYPRDGLMLARSAMPVLLREAREAVRLREENEHLRAIRVRVLRRNEDAL